MTSIVRQVAEHTRHTRGVAEDIILSKMIGYVLGFTVLQLKGYLIKSFFLSIIYLIFMPIVNVSKYKI